MKYKNTLERGQIIEKFENVHFDLCIVGGGITGAGIALDAACNGLKVALIEQGDFASGTSSRSTKLIHGGLRYLKQLEIGIVREVGKERAILHKLAPHLVRPEKMLLPLVEGGSFGKWATSFGLYVYDYLAGVVDAEKRVMLSAEETMTLEPLLRKDIVTGGGLYAEYRTDDARLTLEVIKTAVDKGALCLNYLRAEKLLYQDNLIHGIACKDLISNQTLEIHAAFIINAAGPWVDEIRALDHSLEHKHLVLSKGIHIVAPRKSLPIRHALYFDAPDGRMIFAIPRQNITYIGTTDVQYSGDKNCVPITLEEVQYLIQAVNNMFPDAGIVVADIISSWAGLRPLIHEDGKSSSELSRKDEIFVSPTGLISIAGGKLTGYRKMAERVVDLVVDKMKHQKDISRNCMTVQIPLTSEVFENQDQILDYQKAIAMYLLNFPDPEKTAEYLVSNYGRQTDDILKRMTQMEGKPEVKLARAEFEFCVENEFTTSLSDFFIRRTGRLFFDPQSIKPVLEYIALDAAKMLNWSNEKTLQEKESVLKAMYEATHFVSDIPTTEADTAEEETPLVSHESLNEGVIADEQIVGFERYEDVYSIHRPDEVLSFSSDGNTFTFISRNQIALVINILSKTIFRLRYGINARFGPDFSYAIDPDFATEKTKITWEESLDFWIIQTEELRFQIEKKGMQFSFFNAKGQTIIETEKGYECTSFILGGISEVKMSLKTNVGESYWGLGDKSGKLNLRGKKLQNWVTDAYHFESQTDPLYRSIPFYLGLNRGLGYGIYFDNTYRSGFDFDSQQKGEMSFSANGGEMNFYFCFGPKLLDVSRQYHLLTGKTELPPLWALGFHQCRWSYYPEDRVLELAREFRDRKIPCDAIYLDIDYMDGYRCFTWNKEHFPDPRKMIDQLKGQGFHAVAMIDPGIKVDDDYAVYKAGAEKGYFCKRADGQEMEGHVWPGPCAFPDYTDPKVRNWWGQLYRELYLTNGISGFWNDMNEPALFKVNHKTLPDEVRHDYDGHPCSHKKAHNIYGMQMTRASFEGLRALNTRKRPFLLTRATFSGGQRFAAVWTGDNVATWDHLQMANRQCQRLSMSGFSFCGSDIGGFVDQPGGELFVRWLQMGIFHPLFRVHSMGNKSSGNAEVNEEAVLSSEVEERIDQEPWSFGEPYTSQSKAAIEWRYRLLPYLYTAFYQHSKSGYPVIRSLIMEDQYDPALYTVEREFMVGDHLLISPVIKPGVTSQQLYLPFGDWYYFWNDQKWEGRSIVQIEVQPDQIPFFVRAGAVIPLYPVMQFTNALPIYELSLRVYYSNQAIRSSLYEDDFEGYQYLKGKLSLQEFATDGTEAGKFKINRSKTSGSLKPSYEKISIAIAGIPFKPVFMNVDGQDQDYQLKENGALYDLTFQLSADFQCIQINGEW